MLPLARNSKGSTEVLVAQDKVPLHNYGSALRKAAKRTKRGNSLCRLLLQGLISLQIPIFLNVQNAQIVFHILFKFIVAVSGRVGLLGAYTAMLELEPTKDF